MTRRSRPVMIAFAGLEPTPWSCRLANGGKAIATVAFPTHDIMARRPN
jgi:hypothetical protein